MLTRPIYESLGQGEEHGTEGRWSLSRAALTLLLNVDLRGLYERDPGGAVEETAKALDMSQAFIGIVVLAVIALYRALGGAWQTQDDPGTSQQ